jgi:hypothetical protein
MTAVLALVVAMALACAGVGVWSYRTGHERGAAAVKQQWDAERAATAQAQAEEMMKARQREKALTEALDKQRKERRREIDRITAEYRRTLDSLRDRPTVRAGDTGVPEGSTAGVGCTGAGLSRDDAEFLVWYASEAARVQAALEACVAAYKRVEEVVNGGD